MPFDEETANASRRWYLVHCQPRKETYAANSLRHILKLHVFLPESQMRLRGVVKHAPFFPGYLFVHADLQKHPSSRINACPGVLRMVEFGVGPQAIPLYVIEAISQQLDRFNEVNLQPFHNLKPGDVVRMKHGPLHDLGMMFVGQDKPGKRIRVLLEILGHLKEVRIDPEEIEKAPDNTTVSPEMRTHRIRYTRGKGRKIKR